MGKELIFFKRSVFGANMVHCHLNLMKSNPLFQAKTLQSIPLLKIGKQTPHNVDSHTHLWDLINYMSQTIEVLKKQKW